jgi:hypothetical protein
MNRTITISPTCAGAKQMPRHLTVVQDPRQVCLPPNAGAGGRRPRASRRSARSQSFAALRGRYCAGIAEGDWLDTDGCSKVARWLIRDRVMIVDAGRAAIRVAWHTLNEMLVTDTQRLARAGRYGSWQIMWDERNRAACSVDRSGRSFARLTCVPDSCRSRASAKGPEADVTQLPRSDIPGRAAPLEADPSTKARSEGRDPGRRSTQPSI